MSYHDRALDQLIAEEARRWTCGCRGRCPRCRRLMRFEVGTPEPTYGTPARSFTLNGWSGWTARYKLIELLRLTDRIDRELESRGIARSKLRVFPAGVVAAVWGQHSRQPMPTQLLNYFTQGGLLYRVGLETAPKTATYVGMTRTVAPAIRLFRHMTSNPPRKRSTASSPRPDRSGLPSYLRKRGENIWSRIRVSPVIRNPTTGALTIGVRAANYVVHLGNFGIDFNWDGSPDYRYLSVFEKLLQRAELRKHSYKAISRTTTFED